jgi:nucleoid DNA-binding protein
VEVVAEASEGGEEEVQVTGFGKLVLRSRAKVREGDNPKTKEVISSGPEDTSAQSGRGVQGSRLEETLYLA